MTSPAEKKWLELWQRLGGKTAPEPRFGALQAHYSESHRAYHNLGHVMDCLQQFEALQNLAHDAAAVEMAIWYHDVIYDPRAKDNEERSADVAAKAMDELNLPKSFKENVTLLILATKKHDTSLARDAAILVDVDLSILGRDPRWFDEYERQIRQEYEWVPADAFAAGRAAVLEGFLARPNIYTTESFRSRYEQQAHENMKRSIQTLRKGPAASTI
jgi:predicted metal-dependent HD superfamily phosphohydrolase